MLEFASLTVSMSKLRHYTNFSDRPPLSQYPGSAPVTDRLNQYSKTDMLILNFSKSCLIS